MEQDSELTIMDALILGRKTHCTSFCAKTNCVYGVKYCPYYWHSVFVLYFACEPAGSADPRWETLLKTGLPILEGLTSESNLLQTAS